MTRQTQRFWISLAVIAAATGLTAVILLRPDNVPAAVGSAVTALWTLVAVIVRDNRNRSDIDKEELEAEVSREQRVKASEREVRSFVMGEDAIKEQVIEQMRKLEDGAR